ncbi:MAG TPA: GNAT family N-acetyltransferase [Thermoanaerobaculia bacterium]|jgi:hypothetical protein
MTGDFIGTDDPRWLEALERLPHDVYQRPEYVGMCGRLEGAEPLAFHAKGAEGELLVPLLIRPAGEAAGRRFVDATAPYGYAAPVISAGADADALLDAFSDACRARGLVSAFLRLHPLLDFPVTRLERFGKVVHHGRVVAIDLRKSCDQLRKEIRSNHRRGIQTLVDQGFHVRIDDWSFYDAFIEAYYATMHRVSASSIYFFSRAYFDAVREELQPHVHLFAVCAPGGELAAGGIFFATSGIVQYHLGGTSDQHLHAAPSKLMFNEAMRWGHEGGLRFLHLGGGVGGREDSLFKFKAGLGSNDSTAHFHTARLIFDREAYDLLVQSRPTPPADPEFFPLYRA